MSLRLAAVSPDKDREEDPVRKSLHPSWVLHTWGPHPFFNLFPISQQLIVLRSEFSGIFARLFPMYTSPVQGPTPLLPRFTGHWISVMRGKQFSPIIIRPE